MLCGSLDGRGVWERTDTCMGMTEQLCYARETITILLISYTPIQNKKLKKTLPDEKMKIQETDAEKIFAKHILNK